MIMNEYFDTRTLEPPKGRERACPVRGCKAVLQPQQRGKHMGLSCPAHDIDVHSTTFVYTNPARNIPFDVSFFERAILPCKLKAETHRFGYENSEDALTWNVLAELANKGRLSELARSMAHVDLTDEPELYLWGLRVSLNDSAALKPFAALTEARKVFESDISRLQTEPDIMLFVPGKVLVVVEAKFTSENSSSDDPVRLTNRYKSDLLPAGSVITPKAKASLFSQLYRNLVFAIWMADKLNVEWRLVNLTSNRKGRYDLKMLASKVLPEQTRDRCIRYTWEQLFHDQLEGKAELLALANYLRFKSANCRTAFEI